MSFIEAKPWQGDEAFSMAEVDGGVDEATAPLAAAMGTQKVTK